MLTGGGRVSGRAVDTSEGGSPADGPLLCIKRGNRFALLMRKGVPIMRLSAGGLIDRLTNRVRSIA